jgi:VanZ family protein
MLGYFSLTRISKMPNLGVSFGDKILHFGAYLAMTLVWFNYFRNRNSSKSRSIQYSVIISVVFGMVIEALQGATSSRQTDFYDILANCAGALVAALLLWYLPSKQVKKY